MEPRCYVRKACKIEVVLMTGAEGMLIADAKALLQRQVTAQLSGDPSSDLLTAFCAYAVPSFGSTDVRGLSRRVAAHIGAERAYRDVAVLGFINAGRALPRMKLTLYTDFLIGSRGAR